jgi:hypothetical protein
VTEGSPREGPSDKDQIKPFHAKDLTTGQETADVVAAVLKHAAAKDQAAKQKAAPKAQPIWMLPVGLMMSVLAGFLLVFPPSWVVVNPIAAQAPEAAVENLESAMWLQMNAIAMYRMRNATLPQQLTDAEGFEYTVRGEYYTLCATAAGTPVCYDSSVMPEAEWGAQNLQTLSQRIGG